LGAQFADLLEGFEVFLQFIPVHCARVLDWDFLWAPHHWLLHPCVKGHKLWGSLHWALHWIWHWFLLVLCSLRNFKYWETLFGLLWVNATSWDWQPLTLNHDNNSFNSCDSMYLICFRKMFNQHVNCLFPAEELLLFLLLFLIFSVYDQKGQLLL
jgi:hypothetical protein